MKIRKPIILGIALGLIVILDVNGQDFDEKYTTKDFGLKGDVVQVVEQAFYRGSIREPFKKGSLQTYNFGAKGQILEHVMRDESNGVTRIRQYLYGLTGALEGLRVDESNQVPIMISLRHDAQNRLTRVVRTRGGNSSIRDLTYGHGPKPITEKRTNEKGEVYQEVAYSYDADNLITKQVISNLYDNTEELKIYSYGQEGELLYTIVEHTDAKGTKSTTKTYNNPSGFDVREIFDSGWAMGDYDQIYRFATDQKKNWIRKDITSEDRHRFQFVLRQIVYADGSVTGRLEPIPTDAYVEWRKSSDIWYVSVDDVDIRQQTRTSYLVDSDDALGYDLNSGLSFILEDFKTDTYYTWKPVKNLRHGIDLHWIAKGDNFWVYYKGNYTSSRAATFINDDVVVYLPEANRSFLLKEYRSKTDGKLHEGTSLSTETNVFWFKTNEKSYRLIVNGAYPEANLPSEWLTGNKDIVVKEDGKPKYRLRGYSTAEVGKLYAASNYN